MARNGLLCADTPLRNYSLTHSTSLSVTVPSVLTMSKAHLARHTASAWILPLHTFGRATEPNYVQTHAGQEPRESLQKKLELIAPVYFELLCK